MGGEAGEGRQRMVGVCDGCWHLVVLDMDAAKHPPGHRAAPDLLQKRVFQPQRSIVLRLRSTDFEAVCDTLPGPP